MTKIESEDSFIKLYKSNLEQVRHQSRNFVVFEDYQNDTGDHPISYEDFECEFAAYHISKCTPKSILDIGSYRQFVIGLLSGYKVTTVDIRSRRKISDNETMLCCSATNINLPDDQFDMVLSLCALEHIGLGRYGDEFDLYGDKKAFNEIIRVLKPGGMLVFSTTITNASPSIYFNAHRIYNYDMIKQFCTGSLELEQEMFYSHQLGDYCRLDEITSSSDNVWSIYFGCWKKVLSK